MSKKDKGDDSQIDLELDEKAQVIADATGRTKKAVLEDLMDDGIVNLSNEETKSADLVTQLKEAAELITTVQAVSQQVSENTVLNGGDNKTDVKVETTLEGDIVDRAIASVERKAQNIRKIVVIIAPVMLLLTGGVGLDFFLDNNDGDDSSGDEWVEYGGCLNPEADNYDPEADYDDGTCTFENSGGGGGPPYCNSDWRWDAVTIQDFDANGEGFNNDLQIQMTFNDWNKCNRHMEGYFSVEIWDESRGFMWDQYQINNNFHDQYTIDDHHYDLQAGDYVVRVDYHFDDSYWEGPSALVTMEAPDPEPIYGCTDSSATNYNDEATEDDGSCEYPPECAANIDNLEVNQDGTAVEVIFYITQDEGSSCENFDIEVVLIPVDDNANDDIFHEQGISGTSNYFSHTFYGVPEGDWQVEAVLMSADQELETEMSSWIFVEPEICEINLYDIAFGTNDTHATVAYDLDCGYGAEPGGYNVSVQFMVIGNESYEMGYQFNNTVHYISGYVEDIHTLTLSDFTHENITHYDFAWFAIWGDENNPNYIERYWYNLPFTHPASEPEPEPCENLTLVSDGITLDKDATNNLTMDWKLNHDGPTDASCFVELEVSITLYQNGTYYDISEFQKNGVHKIYANGTLFLDASEVDIFGDLSVGTYEVLVKYRIVGDSVASQDYFANSVTL